MDMKKNLLKIAFIASVVTVGAYGFYASKTLDDLLSGQESELSLALSGIESLADGEYPTELEGFCYTKSRTRIEYQNCSFSGHSTSVIGRRIIDHACLGMDRGTCTQGSIYYYYNCYGDCMSSTNLTNTLVCH